VGDAKGSFFLMISSDRHELAPIPTSAISRGVLGAQAAQLRSSREPMTVSKHSETKPLLIGGAVLLGLVVGLPLAKFGVYLYWMRDQSPAGPLARPRDWPESVRELHTEIERQFGTSAFEVYLLKGQPGWTTGSVVCRLDDSPGVFEFLQEKLDLRSVPTSDAAKWSWRSFLPRNPNSDWWPSAGQPGVEYFASKRTLDGVDGGLHWVSRDTISQKIFILDHFDM